MSPTSSDLRDRLAHIPGFAGCRLESLHFEALPGLTNHNYKVILADRAYVLRLPGAGSENYIDRTQERYNAFIASALGLNPEVVYFDLHSGLQITRFIAGRMLDETAFENQLILQQAVNALQCLHNSGRRFKGHMRLFPKLDEYIELAQSCRDPLTAELNRLRAQFEPVRLSFEQDARSLSLGPCPCHIDPSPANFIATDKKLYLIDWEYSAMCEPLWDLAALSLEGDLDKMQDQAMLHYYFGPAWFDALIFDRFALYKRLLTLLAAAWGIVQMVNGNERSDFRAFVSDRLNSVMRF